MEVIRRKPDKAPSGVVVILLVILAAVIGGIYAWQNNSSVQLNRALSNAERSYSDGDYAAAAGYAEKALEIDDTSADAYGILIDSYAADKNYDAMAAALGGAQEALGESDVTRLVTRAAALLKNAAQEAEADGDTETAVSLYQRIVDLAGSDTSLSGPAREKIAALTEEASAEDTGTGEDTVSSLEKALEADPDNTDTLSQLATAQLDAGDTDGAVETLKKLISLDGTNESAVLRLASIYMEAKDYDSALSVLNRAYRRTGSSVLNARIISCMASKARAAEGEEAVSLWQAVLRKNPSYVEAYSSMSDLYYALGDYDKAVHILEEGYEITEDSLLNRQLSRLQKTLAQEGITVDDPDTKNPVEELVRYAEENNYADALKVMARKEVQNMVTSKKDEADANGRITLSAEDFPDADDAADSSADQSDTADTADSDQSAREDTASGQDTEDSGESSAAASSSEKAAAGNSGSSAGSTETEEAASAGSSAEDTATDDTAAASSASPEEDTEEGSDGDAAGEDTTEEEEDTPAEITVVIDVEQKRFYINTEDGTEVTAYWPAITDQAGRVVIGQYGEDIYGNANYELSDGTILTAYQYLLEYAP